MITHTHTHTHTHIGIMKRKPSYSISLTAEQWAGLVARAEELGCLWGDRPAVSVMLAAVASGELIIKIYEDTDRTIDELREEVARLEAKIEIVKSVLE